MLGVVGSKVLQVSNFAKQLPTTRNNIHLGVVHQQCCIRLYVALFLVT